MSLYGSDNLPFHVQQFVNSFDGARVTGIGARHASWWTIQQGNVALSAKQNTDNSIDLWLGGSPTGRAQSKVRSRTQHLTLPVGQDRTIVDGHERAWQALEPLANGGNDLYTAFVTTFGSDTITSDTRAEA